MNNIYLVMKNIATLIHQVIQNINDKNTILKVREEVAHLCGSFPLYEEVTT